MEETYLGLSQIIKAGINAKDVQLDGILTPAQGRAFANAIVDNSELLKRITVDITGKLTKKRTAFDAAKGVLARHVSGQATDSARYAQLGVIGAQLNMTQAVVLEAQINQETLDDQQDNPSFEAEQHASFAQVFANEIQYLGIVGYSDNPSPTAPFEELAKGWIQLAIDSDDVVKLREISIIGDRPQVVVNCLEALVANAHPDVSRTMAIFCSLADYEYYVSFVANKHQNTAILFSGEALRYKGRELIPLVDLEEGVFFASPLKNMVLGLAREVTRTRWYDNDKSALRYKFIVRPDYEFDIYKYVVICTATL